MPKRRGLRILAGALGGAMTGLGEALDYRRRETERERDTERQMRATALPIRIQLAQAVAAGQITPEQFAAFNDTLQAQSGGKLPEFDLAPFTPTPEQRTADYRQSILKEETPEQVDTLDDILANLGALPGGDTLTAPVLGRMPKPLPSHPSLGVPPTAQDYLESEQFGPVQPPIVSSLERTAQQHRGRLLAGEEGKAERERGQRLASEEASARLADKLDIELGGPAAARVAARGLEAKVTEANDPRLMTAARRMLTMQKEIEAKYLPIMDRVEWVTTPKQGLRLRDGTLIPPNITGMVVIDRMGSPIKFHDATPVIAGLPPEMMAALMAQLERMGGGRSPSATQEPGGLFERGTGGAEGDAILQRMDRLEQLIEDSKRQR